jgi:hypothetical protein
MTFQACQENHHRAAHLIRPNPLLAQLSLKRHHQNPKNLSAASPDAPALLLPTDRNV